MRVSALLPLTAILVLLSAVPAFAQVKVLDDFEESAIRWTGAYQGSIVSEYATHGQKAFKIVFQKGVQYPGITASKIDLDWSGFDTLKIDIYNPQPAPVDLAIRIDDDKSTGTYSSRYNGEFLLVNGQTRLEIPFANIKASGRPIDVARIRVLTIFMSSPESDKVLYFDNMRVTAGKESPSTMGREIISEGEPAMAAEMRSQAEAARARLEAVIDVAHKRGYGTLEANIALITANLGLEVRPELPWYSQRTLELYTYVAESCEAAADRLAGVLDGAEPTIVPPVPNTATLAFEGPRLVQRDPMGIGGEGPPVLIFSMLYHSQGPLCEYFTPINYFRHTHSFAGASRYDVEGTPLYKAFHEYPDTHRVWNNDEGWCGHIVRDSSSLGGGSEPVVVCLESPHTRAAIEEYVRNNAPSWKNNPNVLVNIMGGELSYICYCPYTLEKFRAYLAEEYSSIEKLNEAWGTACGSFEDVKVMPNASQAGENRARWFDWQSFNCRRFVDHAAWAKSIIRQIDADIAVSLGAVSYSVRSSFGRSGVDEENLIRRVDDIVLNEGGHSTITTDLLWSFAEGRKAMLDFEYHGDVAGILPHFLHGNTAMAMWWWPGRPDTEFPQFNETALPYSWNIPLADVAEALKIGLDIRRLGPQIAAFGRAAGEIAILYSRASMLQVPPEFLSGADSPYTMELKNVYEATLGLDAPVRFISSRQVLEGGLAGRKVLIVPGATYMFDDVAEKIFEFAGSGGAVVITPNSMLFDQYARPRERLSKLGIRIASMREPAFATGEAKRDAFLQGLVRDTTAEQVPREKITFGAGGVLPEGTVLDGAGVFQLLEVSQPARAVASTGDGAPAILEVPFGKGVVYYLAIPLAGESMNALVDAVAGRAAVERSVRFAREDGARDWRLEGRSLPTTGGVLFYIVNHSGEPRVVRAALPEGMHSLIDLRDPWREVTVSRIEVAPGRTRILAARKESNP